MNGYPGPDKTAYGRVLRDESLAANEARRIAREKGSYGHGYAPEPINPQPKTKITDEHRSI